MKLSQKEEAEKSSKGESFPDDEKKLAGSDRKIEKKNKVKKSMAKKKKHKSGRYAAVLFFITVVVLVYTLLALFFKDHYFPNTVIDGIDCSYKTEEETQKLIKEKTKDYELDITGRNHTSDKITAKEIGLQFAFDETFSQILESQQPIVWPKAFFQENKKELAQSATFDAEKLNEVMTELSFVQEKEEKPEDASISTYDEKSSSYKIIPEKKGTTLLKDKAKEKIEEAVEILAPSLDLDQSGCYQNPKISADDPELKKTVDEANKEVSSKIKYDWNGHSVTVDGTLISKWIDVSDTGVKMKEEAVSKWIAGRVYQYDTYGKKRTFTTVSGEQKVLPSGSYGWRTDRTAELKKLEENIKKGETVSREPVYSHTAAQKGDNDIGNSYVEINLSAQHVYLFIDGKNVFETDCVSGDMPKGNGTPAGVFGITYKERNATLQGETYSTPVNYWMPFNGNIGLHDAVWRNTFGGTIYMTSGSHGCVNLPLASAKTIYGYVEKGFPVVCYY